MSDGFKLTYVLYFIPEAFEDRIAGFLSSLPATREFPGCRDAHAYRSVEDPSRFILVEEWDSREDQQKYAAWRASTGVTSAARLKPVMSKETVPEYAVIVD